MALAPTSANTAASTPAGFEIQTLDTAYANSIVVPGTAGSLALVENALLLSLLAQTADTNVSAYVRCAVPASSARTKVSSHAPAPVPLAGGNYDACTASLGPENGTTLTGSEFALALALANGTLTATPAAESPGVCSLAFEDRSSNTASIRSGTTCMTQQPCGPPPSLVPSSTPAEVALTNLGGSMQVVRGTLFIHVLGDAPEGACARHYLSLICVPASAR